LIESLILKLMISKDKLFIKYRNLYQISDNINITEKFYHLFNSSRYLVFNLELIMCDF
jgi:hypothetical protein